MWPSTRWRTIQARRDAHRNHILWIRLSNMVWKSLLLIACEVIFVILMLTPQALLCRVGRTAGPKVGGIPEIRGLRWGCSQIWPHSFRYILHPHALCFIKHEVNIIIILNLGRSWDGRSWEATYAYMRPQVGAWNLL